MTTMTKHRIGTREEWNAAREQLLLREKEHTRLGDELARLRRLAGTAREAAGVQAPDGLEYPVGLVRLQRLHLRPRLLAHRGTGPAGVVQMMDGAGLPLVVEQNARATGTDVAGYLTESPGFSTWVHDGGSVHQAYSTTWRGLEFVMGYYPIRDRAPKGRGEGDAWQLRIRLHDEYESER